jgi:hypothetical protein
MNKPKEIVPGVFWHFDRKLYQAFSLRPKNEVFSLGFFPSLDAARSARNREYEQYVNSKKITL